MSLSLTERLLKEIRAYIDERFVPTGSLHGAHYGVSRIDASDFDAADLDASDYEASDFEDADLRAPDLDVADYDAGDFDVADYAASEFEAVGLETADYAASNFDARDLDAADFDAPGLDTSDLEPLAAPDGFFEEDASCDSAPVAQNTLTSRGASGFAAAPCNVNGLPAVNEQQQARQVRRASNVPFMQAKSIDELLKQKEASFSEALLQQIDARKLADPQVYKRANIDRKLFSKIRSNSQYQPKKSTAVALALALNMNLDDTLDLIGRAGYTLTASSKADLIVQYFIEHGCWDVNLINQALYEFDQPLLGR